MGVSIDVVGPVPCGPGTAELLEALFTDGLSQKEFVREVVGAPMDWVFLSWDKLEDLAERISEQYPSVAKTLGEISQHGNAVQTS